MTLGTTEAAHTRSSHMLAGRNVGLSFRREGRKPSTGQVIARCLPTATSRGRDRVTTEREQAPWHHKETGCWFPPQASPLGLDMFSIFIDVKDLHLLIDALIYKATGINNTQSCADRKSLTPPVKTQNTSSHTI